MISIPYYNQFNSIPVVDCLAMGTGLMPITQLSHLPQRVASLALDKTISLGVNRFGGEDFSIGGFISIPPMANVGVS